MINFLIKLTLTILLVIWAILPFLDNVDNKSILGEISFIGWFGGFAIVASFFIMVAFYCRTLQKCLTLIKSENRKAKPSSVWYMFAIPFNFVEDFFIVINVANSLAEEKKSNKALAHITDFGMVSGIGWSIAQIMSFIPNIVGQVAGLVGMILVIYHWIQIAKINTLLQNSHQK